MRPRFVMVVGAALGLTTSLEISTSHADVVGPPATDCPRGSQGDTCHGGPYCRPSTCTDPSDCATGERCVDLDLCVYPIDCQGGGGGSFSVDAISSSCEDGASCAKGSCTPLRVCTAPREVAGPILVEQGCGCAAAGQPSSSAWPLAVLGVWVLARIRWRQPLS